MKKPSEQILILLLLLIAVFSCTEQKSNESKVVEISETKELQDAKTTAFIEMADLDSESVLEAEIDKPELNGFKSPDYSEDPITSVTVNTRIFKDEDSINNFIAPGSKAQAGSVGEEKIQLYLADLYQHSEKPPQFISIPVGKDTTIICNEGTSVRIKANSFLSERTGKPVTGTVQLAIKEYYKLSDMLLANLTTTSNGKLLETGGMIHIAATANGENCVLKKGATIELGFPYEEKKEGMQLFTGLKDSESKIINWQLGDNPDDKGPLQITFINETPASFYWRANSRRSIWRRSWSNNYLEDFMFKEIKLPSRSRIGGLKSKAVVSFVIAEGGNIKDIKVIQGISPGADKVILESFQKMPDWAPGKQGGLNSRVRVILPLSFGFSGVKIDLENPDYQYKHEFIDDIYSDVNIKRNDEPELSDKALARHLFSINNMGWINCDRFINFKTPKTDLVIDTQGSALETDVKIIFHRIRTIYFATDLNNLQLVCRNIPMNEKITIVALKVEGGEFYFAKKTTTSNFNRVNDLVFEPMDMEKLKIEMEKINGLR